MLKFEPRVPRATAPVIALHGWPEDKSFFTDPSQGAGGYDSLLDAGFTVYTPYTGANWLAETATSPVTDGTGSKAIEDARLQAAADGLPADTVRLLGVSMGGGNAISWAMLNPSKVHKVFAFIPVFSLQSMYATLAYRASIMACHGGASWVANSLPRDPYRQDALVDAIAPKLKIAAASDDQVIDYGLLSTWAKARGIELDTLTGGHPFALINLDDRTIPRWLE